MLRCDLKTIRLSWMAGALKSSQVRPAPGNGVSRHNLHKLDLLRREAHEAAAMPKRTETECIWSHSETDAALQMPLPLTETA